MFQKDIHYSPELEKAVIGICLMEPNTFGTVYGMMKEEMFYYLRHQIIFSGMKTMYSQGIPIDLLTVNDYIQRVMQMPRLEHENTAYYLTCCTNDVVRGSHTAYHCRVLADMWRERELVNITSGGLRNGANGLQAALDVEKRIQALYEGQTADDFVDMSALMVQLYKHHEKMQQTGGIGIPTGFKVIDQQQGGFHAGDMIVVGARPGVGKSAWMGQVALHMAHSGKKVGIISLEMSNVQIAGRLAAIDTQTDFSYFYKGLQIDEVQKERLYNRINTTTSTLPIFVSEKTGLNIIDIKARASKFKREHGLDVLMIDYLQLVDSVSTKGNRNREQEVSEMSRGCKLMAKELEIPIVVLAQLNREVTKRKGESRYPELSDLRESGSLEQDADVVMFIHKDWLSGIEINKDGGSTEFEADLIIRKWRNQESNKVIGLEWIGRRMQFVERDDTVFRTAPVYEEPPRQNLVPMSKYLTAEEEDPF